MRRERKARGHSYASAEDSYIVTVLYEDRRGAYPRTLFSHAMKHGKKSVREVAILYHYNCTAPHFVEAPTFKRMEP